MNETPEVTAARLILAAPASEPIDKYAAKQVCRDYLALVGEDADDLVTESWLRSVGFIDAVNQTCLVHPMTQPEVVWRRTTNRFELYDGRDDSVNATIEIGSRTRGQVRKLLAALAGH